MVSGTGLRDVLRTYRQNQDWTQPDLAERWNYSFETISAWERGRRRPTRLEIPRLARLLEMDERKLEEIVYPLDPPQVATAMASSSSQSAGYAMHASTSLHGGHSSRLFPPDALAPVPDDEQTLFPRLSGLDRAIQHYV